MSSPREFAGLRCTHHDDTLEVYEPWPRAEPGPKWKVHKGKKKLPKLPEGSHINAALSADDDGTRVNVLDLSFTYKDFKQTGTISRFLHERLDAVLIRGCRGWRTTATPKRSTGGEYWRVGFRFPLPPDKLRSVLAAAFDKGKGRISVELPPCRADGRPRMSDMDESDYVEIRRRYGNYAPLFFFTDKPIGCGFFTYIKGNAHMKPTQHSTSVH
jgi:hypothetical protein